MKRFYLGLLILILFCSPAKGLLIKGEGYLENIIEDLTPALGNWLDANGFDVNEVKDLEMTGELRTEGNIRLASTKDIYWHDGGVKKSYIEASNSSLDLSFRAIADMFFWGAGGFNFYANDDDSDFVRIDSSSDEPYIQFVGCNGLIYADSGDLVLGNATNLLTDGQVYAGGGFRDWVLTINGLGLVTGASGNISMWTNDVDYLDSDGDTMTGTLDLDAQLELDYTYNSWQMEDGLSVIVRNESTASTAAGTQEGLHFESIFAPTEDWATFNPTIVGCYGLGVIERDNCTGTVPLLSAYYGSIQTTEAVDGGAITVTNGRIINISSAVLNADDTMPTLAGLYVGAQTVGGTNYGIYVAGAVDSISAYFEGDISADDVTDRTPAWLGTSKEALDAVVGIKDKDGKIDHNSLPTFARRTLMEQRPTGEKAILDFGNGNIEEVDVTESVEVEARSLSAMVTLLTEATKEQQKQIEEHEARIFALEAKMKKLKQRDVTNGGHAQPVVIAGLGLTGLGIFLLCERKARRG